MLSGDNRLSSPELDRSRNLSPGIRVSSLGWHYARPWGASIRARFV